ncbi:MAG: serine/threonine protein kinase [Myxococcales bacterium]|nr:serine/threonine protein kinase [Myxococcales bacterium]
MNGTGGRSSMAARGRELLRRAVAPPAFAEPLDPPRLHGFWAMARVVAVVAIVVDVGMVLGLRGVPRIDRTTLYTFGAINLPVLTALFVLAQVQDGRQVHAATLAAGVLATQIAVIVWIQVTGTLSSYFLVAGAMLVTAHRAMLSWRWGVVSLVMLLTLHGGAFVLEELHVLGRAPLFVAAPGAIYEQAAMRWAVLASIASVYVMTWMGANVLVWSLRTTEQALASAERRLAAAADGAREGRLTGRTVGGYRLLEVVGRGGMAEVYRGARAGDDGAADETLAIKVIHPHLVDDPQLIARVRREAALAARLPATVTPAVRDVELAGPGERYVVLDYLAGEDLAALLRRRHRLPLDEGVALIVAACRAVDAVHAIGVVHRDIKPHNLFVLPDGGVRVLDFGIARDDADHSTMTRFDAVLGTPGYIAPEMLTSGAAVGPEADVFALGVVAYQVLGGQRPFPADELLAVAHDTAPLGRLVPDLPDDVAAVVSLAMARAPTRRYRRAGDFADDLERARAGTLPAEVRHRAGGRPGSLDDTMIPAHD